MLEWMSKLLGGRSVKAPADVPEAWADRLQTWAQPLGAALAHDVLTYVLTGEALEVLSTLADSEGVDAKLRLVELGGSRAGGQALYLGFEQVPAAVGLRLARVLEAAVQHSQLARCYLQFERDVKWPELMLVHSAGTGLNCFSGTRPTSKGLFAECLEALCVEDGLSPDAWLVGGFQLPSGPSYIAEQRPLLLTDVAGYEQALVRHAERLSALLLPSSVGGRLHVLKMIATAPQAALDHWAPAIAELATSTSKQIRSATDALLPRCGLPVIEALQALALKGKPDVRLQALRRLATLAIHRSDAALASFARDTAAADKASAVQALIAEWDSEAQVPAVPDYGYELPVIDWSVGANAVAASDLAQLWAQANAAVEKSNAQAREYHARAQAQGHAWQLREDQHYRDTDAKALQRVLETQGPALGSLTLPGTPYGAQQYLVPPLQQLATAGRLTPVALVKMLRALRFIDPKGQTVEHVLTQCANALHRATGRPGLLELSLLLEAHGYPPEGVLRTYCSSWGQTLAADWQDADVWPFVAHHQDLVIRVLTESSANDWHFARAKLFKAIGTLPTPPQALVNTLFELALGSAKGDRMLAQDALKNLAGKETRLIAALESGKAEVRTVAAQWLGRLRHEPAVRALEQAVRKEKHDVAKGALLDALQALGRPVEHYLDREGLARDAAKQLDKGLPKDLEWFPFAALPEVRWHDTQAAVPQASLRWLLVQACKQKSPEPNAVLRKLCGLMEPRDREALGQFVLEAWLTEDVRPATHDEAVARARTMAKMHWDAMQAYPQFYQNDPLFNRSVDEIAVTLVAHVQRQPLASAIGSKGLLAVAAACCAERAAPPVQRYLKAWYGTRAGQGKALIAMLAWIEHPSATQLMLSIGNRFRTKSFQEEATRQAQALAERKGWSLAELADRTIPSAGFDETGTLELSYGPRQFTARLLPDFKIELLNPEGKKVTALPDPRQDDDEAQAKAAKKTLSAAKKELKSIVDLQTDRLYEALCTGRDWPAEDWTDYLLRHPVLRHLVQRLVWLETVEDGDRRIVRQVFRPLDDGSLTDVHDDPVALQPGSRVCLAHDSLLSAELVGAWQQHLADYAVKPLFQQFGKGSYTLPADKTGATEVRDFEGHLIETFALRGRATKLGYTRGASEDGGWFYTYEKRFPTLGLLALIEFTGNGLPEENRTVALRHLSFASTEAGDRWSRSAQPLSQVPPVLLSECYDDLRLIAAEGPGFDPDWEKKSEY
ncbi:DUF4132 domain-containing protein [Pelomonas sp. APW6]|uniref:DUF4132 domain-containing protein n=1 Tax=Roseateles subflavus TaxID=3053353 RepID=A0ABT7LP81_9BURK|nr:DUF4132 domain-containing protein [Pelomonas sp. APW6]MDL5034047.1 DUF4132 domain-containing protein [Pelomonas sp. APW6]